MHLQDQRAQAQKTLPASPLVEPDLRTARMYRWEVVLAYNLEEPFRFRQDYWWLEVLAHDQLAARWVAWEWVRSIGDTRFECTDWVRSATAHPEKTYIPGDTLYLPIHWNVPLPAGWDPALPVRHPATGKRLGFINPGPLPDLQPRPEGEFYLIRHLPASGATAVGLLPLVRSIHPLRLNQEREEGGHIDALPPEE